MCDRDKSKSVNENDIVLYSIADKNISIPVLFEDETFWTTQKVMAELFDKDISVIGRHIRGIFDDEEIDEKSNVQKMQIPNSDKPANFYSLDVIISVGYRVNSKSATKFRQWATNTLRDYVVKGFVLNDDMLKNGRPFGKDYYDELLERIREIRASERRFYQKITDIYATSYDYDNTAEITQIFFATVQNKLLFAVTGETAAELIMHRADSSKDHMGLMTFKQAPDGKVLKSDVTVSKNYLDEPEVSELNRIVAMYLDYAENQASRSRPMSMTDWKTRLDAFLNFNEYDILNNAGKVSKEVAESFAQEQYDTFRIIQDEQYLSDFDKATIELTSRDDK